ncbi:DUF72 domain-containing protein [Ningiella sp. W23]|uniref:DUF72 domain-containing protein n=1 Tax=Ningiella sp. W23 TaxID=3023715 RepID=UPI003756AC1A
MNEYHSKHNIELRYRLGLPAWAFSGWKNKYFTDSPSALASYASVFNTVEGNTTFYQTPSVEKVSFWQEQLMGKDFKICFKLPQSITHTHTPSWDELSHFLNRISPLNEYLGPLLLVFPARVGPSNVDFIRNVLTRIPSEFEHVIEVRHPAFFDEISNTGMALNPILKEFSSHRVVLDSRPLYRGDQSHSDVVQAKHEKPKVPVQPKVVNGLAFVRLVMHPACPDNVLFIQQWAKMVAQYLAHEVETYFTIHCPNNYYCPEFALQFHKALQNASEHQIPNLPDFPVPQQSNLL